MIKMFFSHMLRSSLTRGLQSWVRLAGGLRVITAAGEDEVTFSFGGMVDQIKRSLGVSSVRRRGGSKGLQTQGPAASRLPRGSLPPSSGPKASSSSHRLQAVNGGALSTVPLSRVDCPLTCMQAVRRAEGNLVDAQTGPSPRAAGQLLAQWWQSRPSNRVTKVRESVNFGRTLPRGGIFTACSLYSQSIDRRGHAGVDEETLVASELGGGQDADPLKPSHSVEGLGLLTRLGTPQPGVHPYQGRSFRACSVQG